MTYKTAEDFRQARKIFDEKLRAFKRAGSDLSEAWLDIYDAEVIDYPDYLPSFDEFIVDFAGVEQKPVSDKELEGIV